MAFELFLQAPTFADVNDDGHLEILISAISGAVYVMDRNGRDVKNFPFYTQVPCQAFITSLITFCYQSELALLL